VHRFHILRCRRLCFIHGNNQRDIRPNPSARCCVVELMSFLLAHTSICHLTIERLTLVISASNFHRIRNVSNRYAFVLCIAISTRRCYWYTGDKLTCLSETTCRRFFDRLLVFMGNSIRSSAPAEHRRYLWRFGKARVRFKTSEQRRHRMAQTQRAEFASRGLKYRELLPY